MMTALGVARVIKSKPQKRFANTLPFVRALLSVALVSAVAPAYALEAMTDASMGETTGANGIGFYASGFQFQMPSVAGDVSQSLSSPLTAISQASRSNVYGTGDPVTGYGLGTASSPTYYPGNYGSYIYIGPLGSVPDPFSVTANNVTYTTAKYTVAGTNATPTGGGGAGSGTPSTPPTPAGQTGTGMGVQPIVAADGTVAAGTYAAVTGNTYTIYDPTKTGYANLKAVTSMDNVTPFTTTFTPNRTDLYIYGISLSESNMTKNSPLTGGANFVTTSAGPCTATAFNSAGVVTTAGAGCIGVGSVVAPGTQTGTASFYGASQTVRTLFNATNGGINWGSGLKPFSLSVNTTKAADNNNTGLAGTSVSLPYLQFATPENSLAATDSSNNLRLGFWMNILQEDMTSPTFNQSGNNSLSQQGTAGPALQLQALWDGFGINGSTINVFPTDPCGSSCVANPVAGQGNSAYANVVGFAGVLRFNSQADGVLRLSVGGSGSASPDNFGIFDPYEGLYLQNLDINLPIGNIGYQPLILSSGATTCGSTVCPTIALELARIPNIANVYNNFYINYDPSCAQSGNTCTSGGPAVKDANGNFILGPNGLQTNAYGNEIGAIGLTPQAGMCGSGFTIGSCPTTATHGNISVGNVYTNTTGATQYNYVTYKFDATTQVALATPTTACPTNDTCYSAVPAAICPQGITCSNAIVTNVAAGTVPADPTKSTNAGGTATVSGYGNYNVLYPGASDATYINNAGAIATATTNNVNGVAFKLPGADGAAINMGNAAISGLMINHMKMTLTGL